MKVYLNKITGVDDAMVTLLMSKRTWTREKEEEIREKINKNLTPEGFIKDEDPEFMEMIGKLIKYGIEFGHTTLLRFIDLSFTIEGLHRAAQDDFDSHAARLNNRIVRSSTRLATFENGELSDYYKDKVMLPFAVCEESGIELPEEITKNGITYKKMHFGYIDEKYLGTKEEKDVMRGLYPLGIPSNFIFKVQFPEFGHIVQHRDHTSSANPELKEMIEIAKAELIEKFKPLGENLVKIRMQNYKED